MASLNSKIGENEDEDVLFGVHHSVCLCVLAEVQLLSC